MPFEAVEHGCGWKVAAGGVNAGRVLADPGLPPATREQVLGHLERMRGLVKPVAKVEPREKPEQQVPMLTDVGHGDKCACEHCWSARMLRLFPGARVKTPAPVAHQAPSKPAESKLDRLRRLYPVAA